MKLRNIVHRRERKAPLCGAHARPVPACDAYIATSSYDMRATRPIASAEPSAQPQPAGCRCRTDGVLAALKLIPAMGRGRGDCNSPGGRKPGPNNFLKERATGAQLLAERSPSSHGQ